MVTSLGKYAWDEDETAVYSHLFLGQEAALGKADIRVESAYPWEGSVTYHVSAKIDELFTLAIHIPAYVKDLRVTVNGETFDTAGEIRDGYLYISREWGATIRWNFIFHCRCAKFMRVRMCARTSDAWR